MALARFRRDANAMADMVRVTARIKGLCTKECLGTRGEADVPTLRGMSYAYEVGIVSRSSSSLKMTTVIVKFCATFGLTAPGKTEAMCPRPKGTAQVRFGGAGTQPDTQLRAPRAGSSPNLLTLPWTSTNECSASGLFGAEQLKFYQRPTVSLKLEARKPTAEIV